jgi:hypothetical protein
MNEFLVIGIILMSLGFGILLGCIIVYLTKPPGLSEEQKKQIDETVRRIWQETMDKRV